jgi:hypothetical protein
MPDDFAIWRCSLRPGFCPDEGCPKTVTVCGASVPYGCAREKGWRPGMPSPPEVQGIDPERLHVEILAATLGAELRAPRQRG